MKENLEKIINNAYAPYSSVKVSCILKMENNQEFIGVNVENASFKNGLCAEQVAIASAITEGYNKEEFKEIHIMSSGKDYTYPCFLCRQLLVEFFDEKAQVFCYNKEGKIKEFTVADLCPYPFTIEGENHDK